MTKARTITKEEEARLRECLELDPSSPSGLTWKASLSNRAGAGAVAGTLAARKCGYSYWQLRVDRRFYKAHNVIWLFLHGQWPASLHPLTVDHINRNGSDNSYDNLRLATQSQQNVNQKARGASTYKYVTWHKLAQRWMARWWHPVTKEATYVGLFTDELQAHRAALASRLENYNLTTGEFN